VGHIVTSSKTMIERGQRCSWLMTSRVMWSLYYNNNALSTM
jgi:hypothetical protein